MRIAVLANPDQQLELQTKKIPSGLDWILVENIDQLLAAEDADAYFDLRFRPERERIGQLNQCLPKPVFINSVIHTLAELQAPFIRINAWNGFLSRPVWELAAGTDEAKNKSAQIMVGMKQEFLIVPDLPGMVSARIISMIINEAYFTFQEGVSSKEEIDIAMRLGTNYPFGPFEWSRKIGLRNIYELLMALNKGDDLYKVAGGLEEDLSFQENAF